MNTPDTRRRFRAAAQNIIDAHRAGNKTDPHALAWAHNILRNMPEPTWVEPVDIDAPHRNPRWADGVVA